MAVNKTRYKYLFLLGQFTITDFKMRYSRSVLGYFWSLLNPLLFFLTYYLVFAIFLKFNSDKNYPYYLLIGLIVWNYFAETSQNGMKSLYYKASILTKVNFPRIVIPLSSLLASTLTFLINLVVLFIFLLIIGFTPHLSWRFFGLIGLLVMLSFGVSLFLSTFFLKFRDLEYIWALVLQIGFWLTPIVYRPDFIPEAFRKYIFINPMGYLVSEIQNQLVLNQASANGIAWVMLAGTLVFLLVSAFLYQKFQSKFSEWI